MKCNQVSPSLDTCASNLQHAYNSIFHLCTFMKQYKLHSAENCQLVQHFGLGNPAIIRETNNL